jgi:integrase/recombinase XerC
MVATAVRVNVDWMSEFADALNGRARRSAAGYMQDIRVFVAWFERENQTGFEPGLLNSFDVQAFRRWSLEEQGVKPATWNRRRASLQRLGAWAVAAGMSSFDPTKDLERAKEQELAPRWLSAAEFGRLVRELERQVNGANTEGRKARAVRDAAMVALMLFAGLREGEVAGLTVEDVTLTERTGRVVVRLGKGDKRRVVPLNAEVRRWMGAYLTTPHAGPLFGATERQIQRRVAELGQAAKIEGLTPHRLRHTCAKRLVDRGEALTVVAALLGHSRLDTTRRYAMPGMDDMERAVERI